MSNTVLKQRVENSDNTYPRRKSSINRFRRSSAQSEFSKLVTDRRKSQQINENASVIGSVQLLRHGKLPTNDHLNKVISRLIDSRSIADNQSYMSKDGQLLLQDFKDLLLIFQRALETKNRDELFQSMIYHVKRSEEAYRSNDDSKEIPSGASSILQTAKLFLFNSQFRSLLEQILTIAQQSMGLALQEFGKVISDDTKVGNGPMLRSSELSDSGLRDSGCSDSNIKSNPSSLQPNAQMSDTDLLSGLSDSAKRLNENDPASVDTENAYLANAYCVNPTFQVPDSRLKNALAATRVDRGYVTNLSSLQPSFQISDTDLRSSLAASRGAIPLERTKRIEQTATCNFSSGNIGDKHEESLHSASHSSFADTGMIENNKDLGEHDKIDTSASHSSPKVTADTEKITLFPKTSIGVGAGYDLNPHSVPASEIIMDLRRKESLIDRDSVDNDVIGKNADEYPEGHVIDHLATTTIHNSAFSSGDPVQHKENNDALGSFSDTYSGIHVTDNLDSTTSALASNDSEKKESQAISPSCHDAASHANTDYSSTSTGHSDNRVIDKIRATGTPDSALFDRKSPVTFSEGGYNVIPTEFPTDTTTRPENGQLFSDELHQHHVDNNKSSANSLDNNQTCGSRVSKDILGNEELTNPVSSTPKRNNKFENSTTSTSEAKNYTTFSSGINIPIDKGSKEGNEIKSPGKLASNIASKVKGKGMTNIENDANEEVTDGLIPKLKEIIISVQKNPEYQQAMSTLFSLFGIWGQNGHGGMDRRRSSAVAVPEQAEYYKNVATFEAKTIVEDWAQGKSLDPILQQFCNLSSKIKRDDTLKKLSERVLDYLKKLLSDSEYLSNEKSTKDGDKLLQEIRCSAIEEYKAPVQELIKQSTSIIQTISDDSTSQEISGKIKDIHDHLCNGHPCFKPHLINDIRITLLPALFEQINYIPLPQIIYADEQYDIALENLVFEGDSLMPDIFEIRGDDFVRFSTNTKKDIVNTQGVNIHMSGIHATMNDVIFYFKRKTGFPRMSDAGVLSLITGGDGLRISLRIISNSMDQCHTFKVIQCNAHIDKLDIKVRSCKHSMLYKIINPVLTGIIKRQMAKAIENKLTSIIESGDEKVTKYLMRQNSNQDGSKANSIGRPGLFSNLVSTFNEKVISTI